MDIFIKAKTRRFDTEVHITGSKSESNRLLILRALYPNLKIGNISNSEDSRLLQEALASDKRIVDIHHAGTAMRFLTAYFAVQKGREVFLTGSDRMKQRPVKILVEALKRMGCDIVYAENEGYPPLVIKGKQPEKYEVTLDAGVSSQYISALMMIAPQLPQGLKIHLQGDITSKSYLMMTIELLNIIGIEAKFNDSVIDIPHKKQIEPHHVVVESDWSSVSYYYSIVAFADIGSKIKLRSYRENSFQGDSALKTIYRDFGVSTSFSGGSMTLEKVSIPGIKMLDLNLINTPDIAQTIAVTCLGLGIGCDIIGLHTLKIKETDRLQALKYEIIKLGGEIAVSNDSLSLSPLCELKPDVRIETYQDHRMAMAFAPLCLRIPLTILNADVVGKSYPDFWKDLGEFLL